MTVFYATIAVACINKDSIDEQRRAKSLSASLHISEKVVFVEEWAELVYAEKVVLHEVVE